MSYCQRVRDQASPNAFSTGMRRREKTGPVPVAPPATEVDGESNMSSGARAASESSGLFPRDRCLSPTR